MLVRAIISFMKKFCAMFILLILILPVLYCVPADEISWLYSFLEDNHPDFFNNVGRSQAEEILKEEMRKAEEGQSETETFFSLQRIAAIAHDSHTSVNLTAELFSEMKVYPAVFDFFGEDLIVSAVSSDFEDCLGKTVEQINGTGIEEIIELSRSVVPHDNDVYLKLQLKNNYLSFEDFLRIGFNAHTVRVVIANMDIEIANQTGLLLEQIYKFGHPLGERDLVRLFFPYRLLQYRQGIVPTVTETFGNAVVNSPLLNGRYRRPYLLG